MLATDAEADQIVRDAGQLTAFFSLLLMGGDRRDGSDTFNPTQVGGAQDQLQPI